MCWACGTTDLASPGRNSQSTVDIDRALPWPSVVTSNQTLFSGFAWAGSTDGVCSVVTGSIWS